MIYIYKADSSQILQNNDLDNLLQALPKTMHERALRYRFEKDAGNFVCGRLLLKKGLKELGMGDQLERITYQENGKPLLGNIYFNISHSANLVVCALSTKGALGIDVEKEKSVVIKNFKSWFTEKEWTNISAAPSPLRRLYWYWTRKESIIKALGVNLSYLHQIELDSSQSLFTSNGQQWYLKDLDVGAGFFGALCSEINSSIDMRELNDDSFKGIT